MFFTEKMYPKVGFLYHSFEKEQFQNHGTKIKLPIFLRF